MEIEKLYPGIEFPVSRGTPSISPLIKWDHSEDHYLTRYGVDRSNKAEMNRVFIDISLSTYEKSTYEYLKGHQIEGRTILPAMGYVLLVWDTFAKMHYKQYSEFPVVFENVEFFHATLLEENSSTELNILINPKNGQFQVFNDAIVAASGRIKHVENPRLSENFQSGTPSSCLTLLREDFYKEFRLRGFQHHDAFHSVAEIKCDGSGGKLKWDGKWIPFLDGLLQLFVLDTDSRHSLLTKSIQKLTIDPRMHLEIVQSLKTKNRVLDSFRLGNNMRCGGVEICKVDAFLAPKKKESGINVKMIHKFVSNLSTPMSSVEDALKICVDIAIENIRVEKIKIVEVDCFNAKNPLVKFIPNVLINHTKISASSVYITSQKINLDDAEVVDKPLSDYSDCHFIIKSNCLNDTEFLSNASQCLTNRGFIIAREEFDVNSKVIQNLPSDLHLIAVLPTDENETFVLLKLVNKEANVSPGIVKITNLENETYEWLEILKQSIKIGPVVVYAQNEPFSGILGLVTCVRKEPGFDGLQCVFIDDPQAPPFDLIHPFYSKQLNLGLTMNVLRNGKWGTYRHLPIVSNQSPQSRSDFNFAKIVATGDLSSFKWFSKPCDFDEADDDIVTVKYAALNFRDVMTATGKLVFDISKISSRLEGDRLGFEYSGVKKNGDRVMGMIAKGAFATHVKADSTITFKCPDNWSLEEAATVPIVYLTVYVAFFDAMRIKKGKSILIHAGSGGVGLAAIRVAFAYGLEVYTTVSTVDKKRFLLKEFPHFKEENIGNSRDTSFENMIMKNTKGRGVDYVLNSLSDEKLQASMRCLAENGYFVEIGLSDIIQNSKLDMKYLGDNKTFKSVYLASYLKTQNEMPKVLF